MTDAKTKALVPPFDLTIWLICYQGRPFDYRFSRAAAFNRSRQLKGGTATSSWSVEKRAARLYVMDAKTQSC